MTGRAVSHMVGFILIFGVIMTGATFTLVVGQNALTDMSGVEQTHNAERAMTLLGQDIDHLAFSRSATSETAMNLNDAQIRHDNESKITVTVTNATGDRPPITIPTGSIVNDLEETELRYENGMVVRSDDGNARGLTDPEISCTDSERAIVSIVTLQGNDDRQLGSGRITVDAFLNESSVAYPINRTGVDSAHDATSVSLEVVDSPVDGAWSNYFEESEWQYDSGTGIAECDVGASGEVYVRQVTIDLEFQR